ncbi:MAG: carboxypeptidase regulatory-like domain-containing protein [Candidatus Binataceae bacterium]
MLSLIVKLRIFGLIATIICLASVAAFAYQPEQVSSGGAIRGIVKFDGVVPKPQLIDVTKDISVCGRKPHYDQSLVVGQGGGIANAVVAITNIQKGEPLIPEKNVKFDQVECEYSPHVLAIPAGSTIQVINSDGILHNIHTYSHNQPDINMAQPGFKKTINVTVEKPDVIRVDCDAHNWMRGWWYVAGNPYYAKTGPDGRFTISNVPPGTYTLRLWQEKLGTVAKQVVVKPKTATTVDFTIGQKKG